MKSTRKFLLVSRLHNAETLKPAYTCAPCLNKVCATFTFAITSAIVDHFSYFFTVKFRKDLRRKLELKLSPPLNLLSHYLVKREWSTIHLYIHVSENNMLYRWHLFHEFLFVYLFIPDTDVIMTLLQYYFVCCITHSFQL